MTTRRCSSLRRRRRLTSAPHRFPGRPPGSGCRPAPGDQHHGDRCAAGTAPLHGSARRRNQRQEGGRDRGVDAQASDEPAPVGTSCAGDGERSMTNTAQHPGSSRTCARRGRRWPCRPPRLVDPSCEASARRRADLQAGRQQAVGGERSEQHAGGDGGGRPRRQDADGSELRRTGEDERRTRPARDGSAECTPHRTPGRTGDRQADGHRLAPRCPASRAG